MPNTFFVSDTHFGHHGVTRFLRDDGSKLRPWENIEAMDEALVGLWNATVGPKDMVYHLGDVVINRRHLATVGRLNGRKKLIRGNHDVFRLAEYQAYFEDVMGSRVFEGFIATHIPIHPDCVTRFGANVHGHQHAKPLKDPRYLCISVENTEYRPLSLDEVRARLRGAT